MVETQTKDFARSAAWNVLPALTRFLAITSAAKGCLAARGMPVASDVYVPPAPKHTPLLQNATFLAHDRRLQARDTPWAAPLGRPHGRSAHAAAAPLLNLVVAHYDEDLDWLAGHAEDTVVYCKGPDDQDLSHAKHWVHLRNIGCESHTYLHHIVHHYDHLANITLFSQGRVQDSVDDCQSLDILLEKVTAANPEYFWKNWQLYRGRSGVCLATLSA